MTEAEQSDAAPPAAPKVDGYECISWFGSGASGEVWYAVHLDSDAEVALKVAHPGLDAMRLALFREEARIALGLVLPNVVRTYAVGQTAEGRPWLAMECLDGGTLADPWNLERCADPEYVLRAFTELAIALGELHSRGFVHGDVSPVNTLADRRGTLYLSDFGLARDPARSPQLCVSGGTRHFMAPEIMAGGLSGPRSDVFSLGRVLQELMKHAVVDAPDWRTKRRRERLGKNLDAVWRRATMPDGADRYPSAQELARDLRRIARGEALVPLALHDRALELLERPHGAVSVVLGILVLGVAVTATARLHQEGTKRAEEQAAARHKDGEIVCNLVRDTSQWFDSEFRNPADDVADLAGGAQMRALVAHSSRDETPDFFHGAATAYDSLFLVRASGEVILHWPPYELSTGASPPSYADVNWTFRDWHQGPMQLGPELNTAYVSRVFVNNRREDGRLRIAFSAPVRDDAGNIVAVLAATRDSSNRFIGDASAIELHRSNGLRQHVAVLAARDRDSPDEPLPNKLVPIFHSAVPRPGAKVGGPIEWEGARCGELACDCTNPGHLPASGVIADPGRPTQKRLAAYHPLRNNLFVLAMLEP